MEQAIKVEISKDTTKAYMTITASRGNFPGVSDMENALRSAGVQYGIKYQTLERLARTKQNVQSVEVARGDDINHNATPNLQWHTNTNFSKKPHITEFDRADFKRIDVFENVKKDQLLISIGPESVNIGKNVFGQKLLPSVYLPAGENTRISSDGLQLMAAKDGYAFYEDGRLHIYDLFHVKGDVDYSTGHIKFDGPVVVEGDVRSGFQVEASGNIFIKGNVEAAHLYSQEGDISIQCGIIGKNRCKVLSGGNVYCGFVQDAVLSARHNIIIEHYAFNSTVTCGGKVEVLKKEGLIRGGTITAEKGIIARDVGSARSIHTELKLRNQSENDNQTRLWQLNKQKAELKLRLSSLQKRISFLALLQKRSSQVSSAKQDEKDHLASEINRIKQKIESIERDEMDIQKENAKQAFQREIRIFGKLFANVGIDINGSNYFTDKIYENVKLYRFKNEIIMESLLGMDDDNYDIFIPLEENQ